MSYGSGVFDYEKMSNDEKQFIRSYCLAVQRDYDMLKIIHGLMDTKQLGLLCPVKATECGREIFRMQKELCAKLEGKPLDAPDALAAPEQIATIFTQSFFKLVDSETKSVFITDKGLPNHDGWSSGHPLNWQNMLKSLTEIHAQAASKKITDHSSLLNALINLFNVLPKVINEIDLDAEDFDDEYWDDEDQDNFYG